MSKGIEAKIQDMMEYFRKRNYTVERLADKYYVERNLYAEAVMEGGETEDHYIVKEAARRLLLEKGVGYDNDRT